MLMRSKCAVYISSSLDFSQAERRRADAQEISEAVEGHEKNSKLDPAVLMAMTFVYGWPGGAPGAVGTATDPSTCTN